MPFRFLCTLATNWIHESRARNRVLHLPTRQFPTRYWQITDKRSISGTTQHQIIHENTLWICCKNNKGTGRGLPEVLPSTGLEKMGETPQKPQSGQLMLRPRLEPAHTEQKFTASAGMYNFICSAFLNTRKCSNLFTQYDTCTLPLL